MVEILQVFLNPFVGIWIEEVVGEWQGGKNSGEKGRVVGYWYLEPSSNSEAPLIQVAEVGAEKVERYLFLVFIDYLKTYTS